MAEEKKTDPKKQPPPTTKKQLAPWQEALMVSQDRFMAIAGKERETTIELGFAAQIIGASSKLQACSRDSIINAVINVARTGITLNPVLNLAYLIPQKGKCVLRFDYKGLVKILKDNDAIKHIDATIVYSDEVFEESMDPLTPPVHKKKHPKTEAEQLKREYTGAYSTVILPDNTVMYTQFTPYWEILKAEKKSDAVRYSPENSVWNRESGWREKMIKKTKIRSDFNLLVKGRPSEQLSAAVEVEDGELIADAATKQANNNPTNRDIFGDIPETPFTETTGSTPEISEGSVKQAPFHEVDDPDFVPEHEREDSPENKKPVAGQSAIQL